MVSYLGATLSAVGATDELDMATTMLVTPTIPSLEGLYPKRIKLQKKKRKNIENQSLNVTN